MPILLDTGVGGGGGGGLRLRRPVDVFTGADEATVEGARDTYFQTTNAAALTEFIADPSLAIILRVTGESDAFQTFVGGADDTYDADNWVDRTDAVIGRRGETGGSGTDGARGSLWTQSADVPTDAIFETLSGVAPQRGDHHLRSTNDRVYTRGATADEWNIGANLTGGRGLTGNPGNDGDPGAPGQGVYASFSVDGSTAWHATPAADDLYIRFATGTARPAEGAGSWGAAIRFVGADGEDGADGSGNGMGGGSDGTSVYTSFSVNGSTSWHETPTANDLYIRFASGTERPMESSSDWGVAIRFVGADGSDGNDGNDGNPGAPGDPGADGTNGDSVEIEFSANGTDWHANVAAADTHIRFRVGTAGTWQANRFVGRAGATGPRGANWFVTTETTPQTHAGEAQGDFQIVNDGEASVYLRGATAWGDTNLNLRGPAGTGGDGGGETPDASEIDADLDNDPPQGGTVKAWLSWLAGRNAVAETARVQLGTRLDALEHTAVRAAVDDWNDVTDHLAEYGNAGLLVSTNDWTTVDAAANIWQSSPTIQSAGTYRVIAQLPAEFDIDRFRTQWDITGNGAYNFAIPNASNRWAEFTGTVQNGDPNAKYYVLVDRATGNTQYRASMPQDGSVNLQHNDGTPASVPIPDDTITPAMLDADDTTKQSAFRTRLGVTNSGGGTQVSANPAGSDGDDLTRIAIGGTNYNIPSGGGSGGGGGGDVQLTRIGSRYTFAAAGDTRWYATGITPGTLDDDELLYVRFVLLGEPRRYRPMRGATFNGLPENTAGAALNKSQSGLWQTKDAVNFASLLASVTSAGELLVASDSDWNTGDYVELYKLEGGGGGAVTETIDVTVASAADAAGTTLVGDATITITPGVTFVWRGARTERNAYRIIRMPATTNTLVSIIGENGEGIEGWSRQADNLTWATGPVANNARDPETFTVRVT